MPFLDKKSDIVDDWDLTIEKFVIEFVIVDDWKIFRQKSDIVDDWDSQTEFVQKKLCYQEMFHYYLFS